MMFTLLGILMYLHRKVLDIDLKIQDLGGQDQELYKIFTSRQVLVSKNVI